LDLQHGDDHAASMGDGTHRRPVGAGALTLVVHVLLQVFVHAALVGAVVNGDAVVALGNRSQILHIGFGGGPPDAVDLLAGIAHGLRFTNGGRRHDAGAPQQDVVGAALTDLQPGGFLFDAGGGHRIQLQLETVGLGTRLQEGNGFLAVRGIVVDQGDLLALELVLAALLLGDVLDHDVGGCPVIAQQGEVPFEDGTVGRLRQAVAHGFNGNAVHNGAIRQRKGDAGRLRVEAGSASAGRLQPLIAFHAAVGGIGGFAFFVDDLHAIDAAVTLI